MVFPNNRLILKHISGVSIEFNALDALRKVCNGKQILKVACSEEWKESRLVSIIQDNYRYINIHNIF